MLYLYVRYRHYERFAYRYEYVYFTYSCLAMLQCDTLSSSAANQGDNTVSVAQGGYRNCVITLVLD